MICAQVEERRSRISTLKQKLTQSDHNMVRASVLISLNVPFSSSTHPKFVHTTHTSPTSAALACTIPTLHRPSLKTTSADCSWNQRAPLIRWRACLQIWLMLLCMQNSCTWKSVDIYAACQCMHGTRYYTTADECVRNMRMGTYMYCICLQDTHKHDLPVNTPAWKMMKKINKHEQRTHLNIRLSRSATQIARITRSYTVAYCWLALPESLSRFLFPTTVWCIRPWKDSGDTRFFLRKSLINLNNVLLRFLIRRAHDGIYNELKFMTVGVTHGISKEIAHFTCQFVHETQIDIEIKQHLYCDIRESRVHIECEWLPQPGPCKLARQTHFADRRRIFKSLYLSDSLTCVIYSLSYTLTVVSGVQCH